MLALFPPSSLDNSILTSVLVGLLVVWAFHETLGWGLSGLVVPGYLASIFLIEPTTAVVVVAEALTTWAVVTAVSERVPHWWPWTRLFGRDRFLLFLLVSVAMRLVLEGGGYAWLAEATGIKVLRGLHSMGLVLVPLAANAIWRQGLGRSVVRLGVPVLVTWAIVDLLLRTTNLSLSSFALTYEDLALDFVSSPRAYILLLVGASIGSAVNLRWGWDFGGIIIPGLLALCWMEPHRLLATLGEVLVLTVLVRLVLKAPGLRGTNLTGGRPLVLAFVLAYLAKFGLGWLFAGSQVGLAGRDVFGFGYLLTALLAVRAVRYGDLSRVLVPAVVTSFASFVAATGLGLVLAVLLPEREEVEGAPMQVTGMPGRAAALAAAWTDAGLVPEGLVARVVRGEPGIVAGGDGFGALVVRGGTGPIVSGRLGARHAGPATLAVAEALDARAVLVCAPEGDACESARAELALVGPVLVVEAGDRRRLRLPDTSAGVDLGTLGKALGPFDVETGADDLTLTLDEPTRLIIASTAFGLEPAPLGDPAVALDAWVAGAEAPSLPAGQGIGSASIADGERRVLQDTVVGAWMKWRAGGPDAEPALRLATGLARELGYTLTRTGDASALTGQGWIALLDRAGSPIVVEAPALRDEPGSAVLARALHGATGATLLVLDRSGRGDHPPAHGVLLGALARLGSGVGVVTARAGRGGTDPGAEVVLSVGRPITDLGRAPAILRRAAELFGSAGVPVATWDGSARRLSYVDPGNEARAAAALAAGEEAQVTVFATTAWIERAQRGDGLARREKADPARPTGAADHQARGVAE